MGKVVIFPSIDLDGVKGVLIDIDDTLYTYEPCHQVALAQCQTSWALDPHRPQSSDPLTFSRLYRECRDRVMDDLHPQGVCRSRLLAFMRLFEILRVAQPFIVARKYDKIYWDAFLGAMALAPDAHAFLDKTRERCLPVVAITDMLTDIQIQKLDRLKVASYFSAMVTSEEVGAEKPSPSVFERGLRKLGLPASDVIMIGDSLEKDVLGGASLGIRGYLVRIIDE